MTAQREQPKGWVPSWYWSSTRKGAPF